MTAKLTYGAWIKQRSDNNHRASLDRFHEFKRISKLAGDNISDWANVTSSPVNHYIMINNKISVNTCSGKWVEKPSLDHSGQDFISLYAHVYDLTREDAVSAIKDNYDVAVNVN